MTDHFSKILRINNTSNSRNKIPNSKRINKLNQSILSNKLSVKNWGNVINKFDVKHSYRKLYYANQLFNK